MSDVSQRHEQDHPEDDSKDRETDVPERENKAWPPPIETK